jgi:ATP-dependent exoDNAse (exonuclease V) beta subunit
MSILFNATDHSYKSIDQEQNITWYSVTTVISSLKKSFDAKKTAEKVSKKQGSKWFGVDPKIIQEIWSNEAKRATDLGTFYHNQREADLCSLASIERENVTVPVFAPVPLKDGIKYAPVQKLEAGVYPEHMVYLKSVGICGQSDLVEVVNNRVNIIDYKTNKEIKMESFKNWEGISEKMLHPVSNLEDCNFNHYALQLSIYMYIILKHNPKLLPGSIYIHHIIFEVEGVDQWGYPIAKKDANGEPIVKEVKPIKVPYLYEEVIAVMNHMKENPTFIKKK